MISHIVIYMNVNLRNLHASECHIYLELKQNTDKLKEKTHGFNERLFVKVMV